MIVKQNLANLLVHSLGRRRPAQVAGAVAATHFPLEQAQSGIVVAPLSA
jgi:hypothetical protein